MPNLGQILSRCGAIGALVQSVDWAATELGPIERWPCCVTSAVEMVLRGGFPLSVVLGRHPGAARVIYNDPFIAFLGPKHPAAMGRPAREVWPEMWDFFEWALRQVASTCRPVTGKDLLLRVERGEQIEEIYATISFSPICDDEGPCGSLVCAIETTSGVVGARREHALRVIAESLTEARAEEQLFHGVETALGAASQDVAFALLYVLDAEGRRASLRAAVGIEPGAPEAPREVDLTAAGGGCWALGRTVSTREPSVVAASGILSPAAFVAGPEPPRSAAVVPVIDGASTGILGVLVVGLNPALPFDHGYDGFVRLVAHEIAMSLASVRTLADAQRRADALAQLDRAKTTFLTNVSHEFRTPLTLVIGPLEDLLADAAVTLSPAHRAELQGVRRNAYRLLGYVTTLLDFARADVGPSAVEFEPTDLGALTAQIVASFAPIAARAGLLLDVDCPPSAEPVFVAREMWEQIVLNLLSNALKYTFRGEIAVSLRLDAGLARLTVRDTGTGIPADALPHLFERFYRVPEAPARTREGMGVGLALVKELVKLHGGSIEVASTLGEGTTFTVTVPRGAAHLPAGRVRAAPSPAVLHAVTPFVEDALGWLGGPPASASRSHRAAPGAPAGRILVVEDSPEMRDYLARLLGSTYEVEAVATGTAALAAARASPPDVVVSDVVMPELDGLGLLRALRDDPETREIPVVLLSGRGDEDTLVDALGCGADDYLIKPFSARELRARVRTHLELARARREAGESRLKDVFLGLASHELRTPLTCLKLNVQLVHRDLEALDPRLAARVGVLHRSIDRMTRLVDEMLSISAISAGKLALRTCRCDLREICRAAASEQGQVTTRTVTLTLPDTPVTVVADEDRLGQVVGNLLANALKYSSADRPVTLDLRISGHEAIVTVSDEGAGIPQEDQPRLFERFYRAPNVGVRSGSYVGLGLGLFLARAIVEQHGGRVWVESAVGKGSAFSFAVPWVGEG